MAAQDTSDTRAITSLLASTLENTMLSGVVQDVIFDATPLTKRMRAAGQLKVVSGGERMRISIDYAKNTTAKYYDDLEQLDVTRKQTQTAGFFNWKQASASVVISGKEIRINKSDQSRLFGLLEERMNNAAKSLVDLITTGIYSDGTGSGSKQITGLEAAIETTPGTVVYGAVPIANTAWQNQVETGVGSAAVNLVPAMRTVYNKCSQGSDGFDSSPSLIVMERATHETLEALMVPQIRYDQNPSGGADAGINVLKFKGADVIWSDYCTSGTVYLLNLNHLFFYVHEDANFSDSTEGLQKPVNQDGMVTQMLFMGNMLCNNRRKLGKLTGVTN